MNVPFFELTSQFKTIEAEVRAALDEVLATQQFIMGQKVEALEKSVAEHCRSRFGIGVASGSDALLLSLMALEIGPGDEVLLPPFTFFATAGAVSRLGATPVFVDIDERTYNLDPRRIEERIGPRTKAVLPVHLYGQCADMDPILGIARARGLSVIEDAAQALGAEYQPGDGSSRRRAGSMGDFGCFSFFPTKNLGAFGDAGMVTTDHPEHADRVRLLRLHGSHPKYYHKIIGVNSRLDALQAAVLQAKMRHLGRWSEERRRNAERYDVLLRDVQSSGVQIQIPLTEHRNRHIFHQYVIRAPRRDALRAFLAREGVGTEIYYPVPLHLQECYGFLGHRRGDFPASEKAADETLALPIFPELTEDQQVYVVDRIKAFFQQSPAMR